MRTLILLRGAPGCGKSTWINDNGLKQYTLCADDIRLLCQSPVLQPDGTTAISQANDKIVWEILFEILERRMQHGEFTVIDATNSKTKDIKRYTKLCTDYRYRIFCVDFTDLPIEECKKRNLERDPLKVVPDETIDRMYSRFATQKVPSGIKVIKPDEIESTYLHMIDLSEYKAVNHIGDIHGCYTALMEYFDLFEISDDEYYIFTGDYIDRGIENAEVVEFLISIMDKPNVLMLEGNHERWLWKWANNEQGFSKEFELVTRTQLDNSGISKKDVRKLYRKFVQCAYYKYDDNVFLVTHGGLSTIPDNLSFVATEEMIKGTGGYNDFEKVAETFSNSMPDNYYQIYGHRNPKGAPIDIKDRVYDLEGHIEFGGELRTVTVSHFGINMIEIENHVFRSREERESSVVKSSMADTILALRANPYIREKSFGNISSFNFTNKAFYDKKWDDQTTKARGLYIDVAKGKVAARAYDKFFNINERSETKFDALRDNLKFPVTAYVKENGFLGLISWDEYNNDLLIATKSMIGGEYAEYLKTMFYDKISPIKIEELKEYLKNHDVTFVFECVDMKNDPHVIEYPESDLYLLDIVYNDMDFHKYDYDEMCEVAGQFGFSHKTKGYEIKNWQDFYDWHEMVLEPDYKYAGGLIEGFVVEDSNGWMVKLKLTYYNFWKFMRGIAQETFKNGYTKRTSSLTTPTANEFYAYCKYLYENFDGKYPKDICSLRRMFYNNNERR